MAAVNIKDARLCRMPADFLTVDYTYCSVDHRTGEPTGDTVLCKCRTRYDFDVYPEGCPRCLNLGMRSRRLQFPDGSAPFIEKIREEPDSDTPRLIFGDWLEENGYANLAEKVRPKPMRNVVTLIGGPFDGEAWGLTQQNFETGWLEIAFHEREPFDPFATMAEQISVTKMPVTRFAIYRRLNNMAFEFVIRD